MDSELLLQTALACHDIRPRLQYAASIEKENPKLSELIKLVCKTQTLGRGGITGANIRPLLAETLVPPLHTLLTAWPACPNCGGRGNYIGWDYESRSCLECKNSAGHVGVLWRVCPCQYPKNHRTVKLLNYAGKRACARCDHTGLLLEIPCGPCHGTGETPYEMPLECDLGCKFCNATGFVRSPLAPVWELAVLLYDRRANAIRRGDCKAIAELLTDYLHPNNRSTSTLWRKRQ